MEKKRERKMWFESVKKYFRGSVFTCYCCREEIFDGQPICKECRKALVPADEYCLICGAQIIGGGICNKCNEAGEKRSFERARSYTGYGKEARMLTVRYKKGVRLLARYMAEQMRIIFERNFKEIKFDFITFVPCTEKKKKMRGFNSAEELAREFGKEVNLPIESAMKKLRENAEQKDLHGEERIKNVKDVFSADEEKCAGKTILLIDDVTTTGATRDAAAAAIKRAGAKKVYFMSYASVSLKKDKKEQ